MALKSEAPVRGIELCHNMPHLKKLLLDSSQNTGDELFPKKDGVMLTSDIDYVDVWRVRAVTGNHVTERRRR